jgi:peptidoglycan/xylan/chitin deacetylase (PgdA/CDA1 family)
MSDLVHQRAKSVHRVAKRAATVMLRSRTVQRVARALARARGHRIVLVYHRIGPPAPPGCEIVPCVPVALFKAQLEALREVANVVTLDELLSIDDPRCSNAPRDAPSVAITFDDDLTSHVGEALPALRDAQVRATFFLSGRALSGAGPYWFQRLEALLIAHGASRTAEQLGLPSTQSTTSLALAVACERSAALRRRVVELSAYVPCPGVLERNGITALVAGGMGVGFHTVDHEILPDLEGSALERAVTHGRDELAGIVSGAIRHFAYPHGKVDVRSAEAVRRAGFEAAFTGRPEALSRRSDRHRIGRWEPGPMSVEDLLIELGIRLHVAAARPAANR